MSARRTPVRRRPSRSLGQRASGEHNKRLFRVDRRGIESISYPGFGAGVAGTVLAAVGTVAMVTGTTLFTVCGGDGLCAFFLVLGNVARCRRH